MSIDQTVNLINEYLNDICIFIKYFKEKYHREDILRAWHDGDVPQSGNVTDTIEYELHGIGCSIFILNREIDFDFGPELRSDGFDLWRLKKYLNQRSDISKHLSIEELETAFDCLVKNGTIGKVYLNSNLYFFLNRHQKLKI